MYSQPTHRRHHNAMPSNGRLTPYNTPIKATTRRRESDLSPSRHRPDTSNKDKWQRGDSPPLPPSPHERYRSTTRPSPPPVSTSPLPRGRRRRSSSRTKSRSKRLICYDDLYPSRSRSPSGPSRTIDSYRPIEMYMCDNYGCRGQHSHDQCPLPMRCRGCHSKQHFCVNCPHTCVHCGYTGHNVAYCYQFVVDRDGISRPLELSRDHARERRRGLYGVWKDWDRPQDSSDLRSGSLQRHSTQPSNPTRLSSFEPADTLMKSSQRLAFEEEESIKQARHEADMARKAAAQKLELEHEARLLEMRRQYNKSMLPSNTTSSSVFYPPYDPNGPLEIPDYLSAETSLTMNAPAAVSGYQGRGGEQRIKIEEDIKYVIID